jgi:hypothetical protein
MPLPEWPDEELINHTKLMQLALQQIEENLTGMGPGKSFWTYEGVGLLGCPDGWV